jgi:hypothetical protein
MNSFLARRDIQLVLDIFSPCRTYPSSFFFQIPNLETPNTRAPLAGASLQAPKPSDYRRHAFPFSRRDEADH